MVSPSAVSPLPPAGTTLVTSAVIEPTTRLDSAATAVRYLSAIALAAGSTLAGSRTNAPVEAVWYDPSGFWMPFTATTLWAVMAVNRRGRLSMVRLMSVTSRPNEPALVTIEGRPDEFGSAPV